MFKNNWTIWGSFYFYLVCLTFSISYSVLPFHLVDVFQFLQLFIFFDVLSQAFIKHSRKAFVYIHIYIYIYIYIRGFPSGSDGKASACNVGDPGSIPGLGRSPGEGNDNPLQYSHLENSMDGGACWATVHGVAKSQTWLSDFTFIYK